MSQTAAERRLLAKVRSYKPLIAALLKDYKQTSDPEKLQNRKKLKELYNILLTPSEQFSYHSLTNLIVILEEIPKTELPPDIAEQFKYLMPIEDVIEISDSEETDDQPTVTEPLKQEQVMAGQLREQVAVETSSECKDEVQMTASIDETCSVALSDLVEMKQSQDVKSTEHKSTDSIDSMTCNMISPWQTDSLSGELGINILHRECATLNDIAGKCHHCSFEGSINALVKHCVQMHPCQEVFVSRFLMTKGHEIVLHPLLVTGKLRGRKILFKCLCCEKSNYFTRDEWIEHMENHTGEFAYRCQECLVVGRISTLKHNDACTTRRSIRVTSFAFDGNHLYAYACMLCYYVQLSVKRVQQHLTAKHQRPENITGKLWQKISVVNFEPDATTASIELIPESVAPLPESNQPIANTDGADSSDTEQTEKTTVTLPVGNQTQVSVIYDSDSSDTMENSKCSAKLEDNYACFERVPLGHDSSTATDEQKTVSQSVDSVKVDNNISFAKVKRSSVSISIDSVRFKQDSSIPTEQQETVPQLNDSVNDMEETLKSVSLEADSSTATKRQNMELRRTVPKRQKTAPQRNDSGDMGRNSLSDDSDDSVNEIGSSSVSRNLRSTVSSSNTATNRRKTIPQTNVNAKERRKSICSIVHLTNSPHCTRSQRRTMQSNKAVRMGATTRLLGMSKKLFTGKKQSPEANTSINKELQAASDQLSDEDSSITTVVKPWVENATSKTKDAVKSMLKDVSILKFYKCMEISCSYTSSEENELATHLLHHQEEYKLKDSSSTGKPSWLECAYCDLVADSIEDLLQHLGPSHFDSAFQCPYCFYRSRVTFNVFVHQKQFHPDKNSYTAYVCKESVKRVTEAERSVLKDLLKERLDEVLCLECGKTFCSIDNFKTHVESHELQDITCQYCTETVPTEDIVTHFLTHNKGLVQCLYCESASATVKQMKMHMCNNHSNNMQYCALRAEADSLLLLRIPDYAPIRRTTRNLY